MEYVLLVLGFCCVLFGLVGSVLPALPGLPISWCGFLCLHFTNGYNKNYWLLGILLLVTVTISVLDYIIPAKGTKKFGGSKYGIWGTNIGLIVGIIAPVPFGFIIGPFVGAFIGELLYDKEDKKRALKAAFGSFLGFLAGTFMKVFASLLFIGIFIWQVMQNWQVWF
jgi:uncharacterized protein